MDRLMQESEPIMECKSHVFGHVYLYAPLAEPTEWSNLPWLLRTDKGGKNDSPIIEQIRAEYAIQAYNRPAFVTKSMRYEAENFRLL